MITSLRVVPVNKQTKPVPFADSSHQGTADRIMIWHLAVRRIARAVVL